MNNPIQDLEVNILEASETMGLLGIDIDELKDPVKFGRIKDVVKFLAGRHDKNFIINKLTAGKGTNKIDHIWGYAMLRGEYDKQSAKLKELEKEMHFYE